MKFKGSRLSHFLKESITRISPRLNTEIIYFLKFKKRINLKNPQTLDEKIQYLKFHDYKDNPLVTQCADKWAVRDYIEKCGCSEILNELYGAYDTVDEIPWEKLPQQFVIKWNFGCGQNLICFDKSTLDIENAKKQLREWYKLKDTYYLRFSEMHYQGIKPKLVCERLIETEDGNLPVDYKCYCFHGKVDSVMLCYGRDAQGHGARFYFFDRDWNLKRYNVAGKEAPADFTVPKPEGIEQVFEYAEKISKPFPFVRADFYLEKGKLTFGELTFTPCGGFDSGRLPETQLYFGSLVHPEK